MSDPTLYEDRASAGRALARAVLASHPSFPVVLALPRGGVPVAMEVATALDAPLDVLVVRKIGAPGSPEFGIGAVAEGDITVIDATSVADLRLTPAALQESLRHARNELAARAKRLRGSLPPRDLHGCTAVIVDDGLATGGTAIAAVRGARARGADRVIVAAPVGSASAIAGVRQEADEVVVPLVPAELRAVGFWYRDFREVEDDEVIEGLAHAGARADRP